MTAAMTSMKHRIRRELQLQDNMDDTRCTDGQRSTYDVLHNISIDI